MVGMRARGGGPVIGRRPLLFGAAGTLALAAAGRKARAAAEAGTLTFGLSVYPINLRPFEHTGTAAATVKLQLFRGLLGYAADGSVRGELAESWAREGDSTYVFKLRPNAKFHNGETVTSADVKQSFEMIRGEKSTAYLRQDMQVIDKIETPDPSTVRFVLKEPSATFPLLMACPYAAVVSAKSVAANPAAPVGAGPFMMGSSEKGSRIEVTRFPDYYRPGLPKLDRVKFVVYADDNSRLAALQTGEVDVIEYVPYQNMDSIAADPKLRLDTVEGPYITVIFNTKTGPFANPKLRQAVAFAINRPDIVKAALSGRGAPLGGLPIPRSSPMFDPALNDLWNYDPARAKQLLVEAGFPNGFSTSVLCSNAYATSRDAAEVVQQNLAAIGVQVEIKAEEWASYIAFGNKGQYEFLIVGSAGDYNDPDALTGLIGGGSANYHRSYGFDDPRVNDVLAAGRHELDTEKRKAIYQKLRPLVAETAPVVGLCWRMQGYAMQHYVKDFHNMPNYLTFLSGWTLEQTSLDKIG